MIFFGVMQIWTVDLAVSESRTRAVRTEFKKHASETEEPSGIDELMDLHDSRRSEELLSNVSRNKGISYSFRFSLVPHIRNRENI